MHDPETLKSQIRQAFAGVRYPGDTRLRGSDEGDEPVAVERDFRGKRDWGSLDAEFLDRSPNGLASALSMFSHEAFRFYLPAYRIADIDGKLEFSDPVFRLTHGVDSATRNQRINPRRCGDETWSDYASERFARCSAEKSIAIVAYLSFKREQDALDRKSIDEALEHYWNHKMAQRWLNETGIFPDRPPCLLLRVRPSPGRDLHRRRMLPSDRIAR